MPDRRVLSALLGTVTALALTAVAAWVALGLGGFDARVAAVAMVRGTVGTPEVLLSVALVRAVPLILTGLAVALAFRAGVWNIGAEGQLYAGAVAAAWVGLAWDQAPAWLLVPAVLTAAAGAGALWAAVPTFMKLRLGVGEVITTLLMNFVGIHLAAWVVHGPLQESRGVFPQTDPLPAAAHLPLLVPGSRLHAGFLLAIGLAAVLWAVLRFTRFGFAVRAVGASPDAARVAGRMDARRVVLVSFLTSGAVAGLAGGVEVAGVTFALYEGLSPGWGYTAIAVALLAGLNPAAVVATGLFFGMLEGGAGAMQRAAGVPSAWVNAMVALVILSVLAVDQVRRRTASGLAEASGD
jgi:simple sugar transport system permease protein